MKILVLSDLHNEFEVFEALPIAADVVILAGDIDVGTTGIGWAERTFSSPVIYVAGNHEFFRGRIEQVLERLKDSAAATRNVHFLEDSVCVIDGVRFIGATLWTDFELFGAARVNSAIEVSLDLMVDYRLIGTGTEDGGARRLVPADTIARHHASRNALEKLLAEPFEGKTVVVTHHLPHWGSVQARWREVLSSAAFASDLEVLIAKYQPALWVHGHTHDSADYFVGQTRVVCNPRGYVRHGIRENGDFIPGKSVTLDVASPAA